MAFNVPPSFALITQPIGEHGIHIWSYETDDSIAEAIVTSYFTDIRSYGARLGDIILCVSSDGERSFILSLVAIDVSGDGTAVHIEDIPLVAQGFYDTWAEVEATIIPETIDTILVGGHTVAGEGAAMFKRVAVLPTHPGAFSSEDGAHWEIIENSITPEMLGGNVSDAISAAYATGAKLNIVNGNFGISERIVLTNNAREPLRFLGDGIGSSLSVNNETGGIRFESDDARTFVFGRDFAIEAGIDGAGTLLDIDYGTKALENNKTVRLDNVKLGARFNTDIPIVSSTNPLRINNASRIKLTDIAAFASPSGGPVTTGFDITENYNPEISGCRLVGRRGGSGIKISNLLTDTEGVGLTENYAVGFDKGLWIERAMGQAPSVDVSRNYLANYRENARVDGSKYGFIKDNQSYTAGVAGDGFWQWGWTGTTLTITAEKPHELDAANHVVIYLGGPAWAAGVAYSVGDCVVVYDDDDVEDTSNSRLYRRIAAGTDTVFSVAQWTDISTDWVQGISYVTGNKVLHERMVWKCLVNHTSLNNGAGFEEEDFITDKNNGNWDNSIPLTDAVSFDTHVIVFTMKSSLTAQASTARVGTDGDFYDFNLVNVAGLQVGPNAFRFGGRRGRRHVRMEPGGAEAKPAWAAGQSYTAGEFVTGTIDSIDRVYKCGTSHLSPAVFAVTAPDWVTGTAYVVDDPVQADNPATATGVDPLFYMCVVAHTAGTFATDLAAGKWLVQSRRNRLWFPTAIRDVRVGPDLLHGYVEVPPYYIGPGCENIFVHLPYLIPTVDGAGYPRDYRTYPHGLVEIDPSVTDDQVVIRDDLDVLHGWQSLVAAATTDLDLLPSRYIELTTGAPVTINNFGFAPVGRTKWIRFKDAGITVRHLADVILSPGGANVVTAAGDKAQFVCTGTPDPSSASTWECLCYTRAAVAP